MERGDQSDDPWGDDPHGPGDPTAAYPTAPLPAHERVWRHPSELGQAQWAMSEPPLVVGRGLLAATGAIGTVLGLTVLWMLVPAGFDSGRDQPTAGPDVTRSVQALAVVTTATPPADGATGSDSSASVATLPAESVPPNTLRLSASPPRGSGEPATATAPTAIAVMVNGTGLLLTTAAAVKTFAEVAVADQHDEPLIAQVVAVDQGVALLAPSELGDTPLDVIGFDSIATADVGDPVMVLGDDDLEVTFPAADAALDFGPANAAESNPVADLAEGTPVVDTDGALVGLCTMVTADDGSTAVHVVSIAALLGTEPTSSSPVPGDEPSEPGVTSTTDAPVAPDRTAWLGVQLEHEADHIGARIDAVMPGSPADSAGLRVGEVVVAIDGRMVASVNDLVAAIAAHQIGDVVVLTVVEPTDVNTVASGRLVSVLLGAVAPSA
ncbi:MAG: PDZ domain-containing protein [Actinomycetota bacterium]